MPPGPGHGHGGAAPPVGDARVGPGVQHQHGRALHLVARARQPQRRLPVPVHHVHGVARRRPAALAVELQRAPVLRGLPSLLMVSDQLSHQRCMPSRRRDMERRRPVPCVSRVDGGAAAEQRRHDRPVSLLTRPHERRPTIGLAPGVDLGTPVEQHVDQARLAVHRRGHEQCEAAARPVVVPVVDERRFGREQRRHLPHITPVGRLHQPLPGRASRRPGRGCHGSHTSTCATTRPA